MTGIAGLGGQTPPRPDQTYRPGSGGAVAPGPQQVIRVRQIIIYGAGNVGLFEYSGTPGLGNPPVAYSAPPGVTKDPYGNLLPNSQGGFSAQGGTGGNFAQLSAGQLSVTNNQNVGPGTVSAPSGFGGTMQINSPLTGSGDTQAILDLISKNGSGNTTGVPIILVSSPVVATSPSGHIETWHNLALTNGWAVHAGTGLGYARFRLMPDNSVKVNAKLTAGTLANGTVIANLGAGYLPAFVQPLVVMTENPTTVTAPVLSPRIDVQTNGDLQIFNMPAGLTQASINGSFPLD